MLLSEKLKDFKIILGSNSPRRKQFINDLGLDFEIRLKDVDENYPQHLRGAEIADYLSELKAEAYLPNLQKNEILITGDTVVWHNHKILHKPKNYTEAFAMLQQLSGSRHEVISAACVSTLQKQITVHETTQVYFKKLSAEEIDFYINTFQPYDKAGAYGIQEWIGKIGIEKIEGSFYNVMGMPVHQVYEALRSII